MECIVSAVRRTNLLLLFPLLSTGAPRGAPLPALPRSNDHPVYDGAVIIEPQSGVVQAQWTLSIPGRVIDGDSLVLLLNENFRVTELSGRGMMSHREVADAPTHIVVRFARVRSDPVTLDLKYSGTFHSTVDSINSIGPTWVELSLDSFWQPIVNGMGESITSHLRVTLPSGWRVISGGPTTKEGTADILRSAALLPDVPFVAAPNLRDSSSGTTEVAYVGAPTALVGKLLTVASGCARHLDAIFGPGMPLPPLRIVLAPRAGPGYARKNYIVGSSNTDTSAVPLERFLCHELAHFWASGAVPSGPENWLNEGMAEFLAGGSVKALSGPAAYDTVVGDWLNRSKGQGPVWTDTSTRRPNRAVAYFKSALVLDRLQSRIGEAKSDSVIARFLCADPHTTPRLLAVLGDVVDSETAAWFRAELAR